ncbi:hypothetical protein SAMN04487904_11685 [Actinopolyspora lacussalsi subsp. righensis]|uniref:PH domain-containing protein n=1 Tax=Actinopolyspora righensis TaxID=995060 RepID=A0A1I7CBI7_9ACTN|nr:hypothetical protein [Actinopolyspora righensis]SFT96785.1 hypothetical protein SAMN04487904_11685 [Actinopolyspora righensis]
MSELDKRLTRHLPWPEEWPAPGGLKDRATAAAFVVLGAGSVIAATSALSANPPDARGLIMAACAPLLLGFAGLAVLTRLRVRDRGIASVRLERVEYSNSEAVVIPYSRGLASTYVVMTVSMLALFGFFAVISLLVIADGGPGDTGIALLFIASGTATLYLLLLIVEALRGALSHGVLALAPTGVYHRSWAFTSFFPWESIVSISAGTTGRQLITAAVYDNSTPYFHRRSRMWRQPELSLAPHMGVQGVNLSVDPTLAYHALHYYQRHSEMRIELGNQAGVDRIRGADLLDY